MRILFNLLFSLICVLFIGCVGAHETPLFRLRGEIVEAIEGGPIIIKATLVYQGKEKMEIRQMSKYNARIGNTDKWRLRLKVYPMDLMGISPIGCLTIAPGETFSEYIVVHDHCDAPVGKCNVDLAWYLYGTKDKNGQVISDPSTRLVANVLPATTKNLVVLRERLIKLVNQRGASGLSSYQLADMVLFTKHRSLLPVAWTMLETGNPNYPAFDLIHHIYALSPSEDDVHGRMVNILSSLNWRHGKLSLFWYWQLKKVALPDNELKKLMDTPDIWVRVLTYEAFGKKCDRPRVRSLLAELRQVARPLPKEQFARLLAELDDDRFQTREKAMTKLIQQALRVESQLQHCDRTSLSPEATHRVTQILARIAERRSDSPAALVLNNLVVDTPKAQAILQALADGRDEAWLTKEAKRLLTKSKRAMSMR